MRWLYATVEAAAVKPLSAIMCVFVRSHPGTVMRSRPACCRLPQHDPTTDVSTCIWRHTSCSCCNKCRHWYLVSSVLAIATSTFCGAWFVLYDCGLSHSCMYKKYFLGIKEFCFIPVTGLKENGVLWHIHWVTICPGFPRHVLFLGSCPGGFSKILNLSGFLCHNCLS